MTRYTPETYHVYNEFDKHGLLIGLPRIEAEHNSSYKQRLLDVFVNRADSTYRGLLNAITRELGLSLLDCMTITPKTNTDGSTLLEMPAVVFKDTKCYLYENYRTRELVTTLDRFDISNATYDIFGLYNAIIDTGYWDVSILSGINTGARSMTIFNQGSIRLVYSESIISSGAMTKLANENLIEGTVSLASANLTHRVSSQVDLKTYTDYCIDYTNGIIYSVAPPAVGSFIRYEYCLNKLTVQSSPVILHNLQSEDFQTKMFEQVEDENGDFYNGRPTTLGANLINELLSIYPSTWGK